MAVLVDVQFHIPCVLLVLPARSSRLDIAHLHQVLEAAGEPFAPFGSTLARALRRGHFRSVLLDT